LAIIHGCFAQAFFALAASIALFTSREWSDQLERKVSTDAGRVQRLGVLTTGFLYIQLILGAIVRHRGELVEWHMGFAFIVAIHVMLLANRVNKKHADIPTLAHSAALLRGLLLIQLSLGFATYMAKFTVSAMFLSPYLVLLATSHVVIGALMLVTSVRLTLRAFRFLSTQQQDFNPQLASGHASV
jgi:cytochrome c oxidase assembly protein subunit 15